MTKAGLLALADRLADEARAAGARGVLVAVSADDSPDKHSSYGISARGPCLEVEGLGCRLVEYLRWLWHHSESPAVYERKPLPVPPPGEVGISYTLDAMTLLARKESAELRSRSLAALLARDVLSRREKIQELVSELHRRFVYAPNPVKETIGPAPFATGEMIDADDACVFVGALAASVGIPCRFIGARYNRSWTCFVSFQTEEGEWERINPLKADMLIGRVPDESVMGPLL